MARGELRIGGSDETDPEEEVAAALAAFGLEADEPLEVEETFALWPECLEIFNFWRAIQTQWHIGPTGRETGLNYGGVEAWMNMMDIPKRRRKELLCEFQVMEYASLQEWAKKR